MHSKRLPERWLIVWRKRLMDWQAVDGVASGRSDIQAMKGPDSSGSFVVLQDDSPGEPVPGRGVGRYEPIPRGLKLASGEPIVVIFWLQARIWADELYLTLSAYMRA